MSRYIDADALKETIDREIFRHDTIDHVFQIIDDAPTIEPKRGEWIPCSERLPEEEGIYLVTATNFIFNTEEIVVGTCYFNIEYGFSNNRKILAWMPLPEPYGEREGEVQTIRCPKCGRTDCIRDMEKDMGIKGSHYKYKCINCNTYINVLREEVRKYVDTADTPQTEREGE